MKLLSLDPNTRATGAVLWEHGGPTGRFTVQARSLDGMCIALDDAIAAALPHTVAVEGAYLGDNPRTYGVLSQLLGAIRMACVRRGIDLLVLSTAEIDRSTGVSGDRKAGNAALARYELEKLNGGRIDEHQSDAYAIGVAALGLIKAGEWVRAGDEAA